MQEIRVPLDVRLVVLLGHRSIVAWSLWNIVFCVDGGERQVPARLVYKQDGVNLTGSAGPDAVEQHTLENGKIESGSITFQVPTPGAVMKFALKHEGDEMKGEVTRERDGQTDIAKVGIKRDK